MKVSTSVAVLAAVFVGATAQPFDATFPPIFSQTNKELFCKDQYKTLVTCALSNNWNSAGNAWSTANPNCLSTATPNIQKCKGATVHYQDPVTQNLASVPPAMGTPAYIVAGGVTKAGSLNAIVGVPSIDQKLRSINCNVCSKFAKKLAECALPVTNVNVANPALSFLTAASACITTNWDKVLFDICLKEANISPLTPTPANTLTYLFYSPVFKINNLFEACPSIETRVKDNGIAFGNIQKGHIGAI